METTPNLGLRLLVQSQSQKEITVNEALCRIDALQAGVLSRTQATPPSSPTDGLTYIVSGSATGAWSGKYHHITYYLAGWHFIAPRTGMNLWVADEAITYRYNGTAWVRNQSLTPGELGIVGVSNPREGETLTYQNSQWENLPAAVYGRNRLINGTMQIWQRASSFTLTTASYTADRFLSSPGTGGTATISRQSFSAALANTVPGCDYFLRHAQTTAGSTPSLVQRIEFVRSLAGEPVTLSFYARTDAALSLTPRLTQFFGTGGSPSSAVVTTLDACTITTDWQRCTVQATLPATTSATLGTNGNDYLQLELALPSGASFTLEITALQLEAGNSATAFEQRSFTDELHACRRYFYKSVPYDTPAAAPAGRPGALSAITGGTGLYGAHIHVRFPTTMRASPSINLLSTDTTAASIYSLASGNVTSLLLNPCTDSVTVTSNQTMSAGIICYVHLAANAEL
jgi:hypothetical protein